MPRTDPTLNPRPDASRRRLLIAAIAAGTVLAVLVGVGVYGLLARPHDTDRQGIPGPSDGPAPAAPATRATPDVLPELPHTNDPIQYAEAVAEGVFTWDTATGHRPLDYASVILADADPSGIETAGLASDITAYQPTSEAWRELTQYATAQHLRIDTATIPDSWDDIVAEDTSGTLVAGMTAVTIDGTRHRTGIWNDEVVETEHEVAFTVFLACPPAHERCHVLRLSALDTPLR